MENQEFIRRWCELKRLMKVQGPDKAREMDMALTNLLRRWGWYGSEIWWPAWLELVTDSYKEPPTAH